MRQQERKLDVLVQAPREATCIGQCSRGHRMNSQNGAPSPQVMTDGFGDSTCLFHHICSNKITICEIPLPGQEPDEIIAVWLDMSLQPGWKSHSCQKTTWQIWTLECPVCRWHSAVWQYVHKLAMCGTCVSSRIAGLGFEFGRSSYTGHAICLLMKLA